MWVTPFTFDQQAALNEVHPALQVNIMQMVLARYEETTLVNYGAGLLRFTQFCDTYGVSERARMPASPVLLSAFASTDACGKGSGSMARSWFSGLQLWHRLNGAPWYGKDFLVDTVLKTADKMGINFQRPPRNPVSLDHLRTLRSCLDLSQPRDAAIWAVASAAFAGCRRLGELLPCSGKPYDPGRHPARNTRMSRNVVNGHDTLTFRLPWTKMTGTDGGQCTLTSTAGTDRSDLCPVWAFNNHLSVNNLPHDAPLFAYSAPGGSVCLTKETFLDITSYFFRARGLEKVHGHSYRIGGSVQLLLDGVSPEHIMTLGGWSSLCFLLYWRRLELVVPAAITTAWRTCQNSFSHRHDIRTNCSFILNAQNP